MTGARWREGQVGAWAGFLPVRPHDESCQHSATSELNQEGPSTFLEVAFVGRAGVSRRVFLVRGLGG